MSGPKGMRVEVVSARELERRARVAAEEQWTGVQGDLRVLTRMIELARGRGVKVSDAPNRAKPRGDAAAIRSATDELRGRIAEATAALDREMTEHRAQELLGSFTLRRATSQRPAATNTKTTSTTTTTTGPLTGDKSQPPNTRARESVARLLARAEATTAHLEGPGAGGDELQDACRSLADRILNARERGQADLLLAALRSRVQEAEAVAADASRRRAACRAALDQLAGCFGSDVERLRAELAAPVHAGRLPLLLAEVEAAAAAWRAEQDRQFALAAFVDVLADMGYDVQPGLDTLVSDGGTLHLHHASWGTYGVRLRSGPGQEPISAHVVRNTAGDRAARVDAVRDAEIEREWCDDLAQARQELARRGVLSTLVRSTPPGALPVLAVDETWLPTLRNDQVEEPRQRILP